VRLANACSLSRSALISPALASSMILRAMIALVGWSRSLKRLEIHTGIASDHIL
jgi:hypothetical protein